MLNKYIFMGIVHVIIVLILSMLMAMNFHKLKFFNRNRKCYFKIHIDELKRMDEDLRQKGLENEKYIQFEHNNVILLHQKAKIERMVI